MAFPTWKVHTFLGALGCPFQLILKTHSQIMPNCQKVNTLARISSQNWHLSAVTFSADTLKVSKAARVLHIGGRARERATERSEAKNARSHRGYIEVASYTTVRAPHRASGSFSVVALFAKSHNWTFQLRDFYLGGSGWTWWRLRRTARMPARTRYESCHHPHGHHV